MKLLKRVLAGLLVAVAAVAAAGYAILANLDFEDLRTLAQDQVREATGRDLVIGGDVDLRISWAPKITLERVTFANAPWGSRQSMMTVRRFELEVRLIPLLSGDIVVKRLVMLEPDILLETDAEGQGNWLFDRAAAEAAEEAEEAGSGETVGLPDINRLLIRDGQWTYINGRTGQKIRIELDRVEASNKGFGTELTLALEGRYNDVALSIAGLVGPLKDFAYGEPWPLDVTAKVAGAVLTAKGMLQSRDGPVTVDLELSAAGASLADFSALAGSDLPALGPYKANGKITGAGGQYSVKGLAVTLGQSDLAGNIDLAFVGERPRLAGNLTAKLIDLSDFQAKPAGGSGGASGSNSAATDIPFVFTADPLPLNALRGADADVKLIASSLRLPNSLVLQDLDLMLKLAAGKLMVEPLKAGIAGGRVESTIRLDAGGDEAPLALKLQGREIDYGRLLKDLGVDDRLSGRLDLTLDLESRGGSLRAHASSASGLLELVSKEGRVDNQFFKIMAVGLGDILGPLMGEQQEARVNCIVARFDVNDGQAQSRGLVFDSEALSIVGQGRIDLKTETLRLDFDTATRQASLASLAVPFKVRGTLKSPSVSPDPVGAAVGVAESLADTGINTVGSIGELVSGLFGGDSGGGSASNENLCAAALAVEQGRAPVSGDATTSSGTNTSGAAAAGSGSGSEMTEGAGGSADSEPGSDVGESLDKALGDFKKDLNKIFGGD